jgi:histidinol phosphatase-like PHP family hydrolase
MFLHEKTYNLDDLTIYNTHTHSNFSHCAKKEMVAVDMIKAAEKAGIKVLAITDHNYPEQKNWVAQQRFELLRQIKDYQTDVKVFIGAELSSYDVGKFADDISCDMSLDWKLYTTNHFHQKYWAHPKEKTPRAYCELMLAIMDKVIDSGRADAFAHPFMAKYISCFKDFRIVTASFKDNEIGDIMEKATEHEITWELNVPAVFEDPVFYKRYFQIGKEVGVIFNIGTDAHELKNIDVKQFIPELKRILY